MTEIYLALGSNVGNSKQYITQAIKFLEAQISNIVQAPIYQSKPVGFTKQANFLNTAVKGQTDLKPPALLTFIKEVEQKVGRIERFRWGPREIDIDIIFYGKVIFDKPKLHIPHQKFAERDFVLRPICDLNSKLVDPRSKLTVSELLNKLPKSNLSII